MAKKPVDIKREIETINNIISNHINNSPNDAKLIENIKKRIIENKRKDTFTDVKIQIEDSIKRVYEHQKFTSIAANPFIQIHGKTAVPNHHLIMMDPFVSVKDPSLKKNFDVLIFNIEEKYNTLIFLETKTSRLSERLINSLIKKIQIYESYEMQKFIKDQFKNLKIDRIEYVLLIRPHRYDFARRILKNKKIKVTDKNKNQREIEIPLILWTINRSIDEDRPNYYFLLMQPYNEDINNSILLRQTHLNKNLRDFLTKNVEYSISTELFHTNFSPVLDFNYQLKNAIVHIFKIKDTKVFVKQDLIDLISTQIFQNLRTNDILEYISNKIIKKGIKARVLQKKEINEEEIYIINLDKRKQADIIQNQIIEKICSYKTNQNLKSDEAKLEISKSILNNFLDSEERKIKIIPDFFNKDD